MKDDSDDPFVFMWEPMYSKAKQLPELYVHVKIILIFFFHESFEKCSFLKEC